MFLGMSSSGVGVEVRVKDENPVGEITMLTDEELRLFLVSD